LFAKSTQHANIPRVFFPVFTILQRYTRDTMSLACDMQYAWRAKMWLAQKIQSMSQNVKAVLWEISVYRDWRDLWSRWLL